MLGGRGGVDVVVLVEVEAGGVCTPETGEVLHRGNGSQMLNLNITITSAWGKL